MGAASSSAVKLAYCSSLLARVLFAKVLEVVSGKPLKVPPRPAALPVPTAPPTLQVKKNTRVMAFKIDNMKKCFNVRPCAPVPVHLCLCTCAVSTTTACMA